MTSVVSSALSSAAATSDLEVPTNIARTDDFRSLQNHAAVDKPLANQSAYEGIDWRRLKGYSIPSDDADITSGVWRQGWRLWKTAEDRYWWLCRRCHLAKRGKGFTTKEPLVLADKTTSGAIYHLKTVHSVDKNGNKIVKKRKGVIDQFYRMAGHDDAAAVDNTLAAAFDKDQFKAYLYDYVIANSVPFEQLDSPQFRRLIGYLNPRVEAVVPSSITVSRTVAICYDKALGVVTETLQSAITKINLSFDLWTSKNKLALLGLCAHFINNDGKSVTTLLALPRQKGRHSGFAIAETVSDIIAQYGLQDRLGYFTTDNAIANEKTMGYIASEHGFERDSRWVRCSGHIFNLVGQAALFGLNNEAFSAAVEDETIEDLEHRLWRRKGPIGKLHNIIYWVNRSPQRWERFEAHQRRLVAPQRPEDKNEVYELIKDVETRWNSFYYSAERACYLRPAIDELLMDERTDYERYCARCERSNRPIKQQPPAILNDTLSDDEWTVITRYIEILKPLKDATLVLEGHAGGRFGAIWQVLPLYERLLEHLEDQVVRYPIAEELLHQTEPVDSNNHLTEGAIKAITASAITAEHHFSINIKLAWQKLDIYYAKLDNTPLYVAAVVLHPRMKWRWIERAWQLRPEWIKSAKSAFNSLLIEYERPVTTPEGPSTTPPSKRRRRRYSDDSSDSDSDDSEGAQGPESIEQQLAAYMSDKVNKELSKKDSPVQYWLYQRQRWPYLSALALDVYSVAVMSDEPERVFSITGAAVTPRRRLLKSDKIAHLMCLKAWIQAGIITLDR